MSAFLVYLRELFLISVGDRGAIVATVDGGETWTTQTSGTDRKLRSVFFLDQDTGWIAGGESPLIVLYTVDGGDNWEALSPQITDAAFLNEIQFASSTHGFGMQIVCKIKSGHQFLY